MPRKQRFKPSRKPKLADGTTTLTPVANDLPLASLPRAQPTPTPPPSPPGFRPVRGKDAVIDEWDD